MESPRQKQAKKVAKQLREIEEAEGLWDGLLGEDFRSVSVGQKTPTEDEIFADRCLVVQQALELGVRVPKTLLEKYGPDAGIEPNPPVPEDKSEGPPF